MPSGSVTGIYFFFLTERIIFIRHMFVTELTMRPFSIDCISLSLEQREAKSKAFCINVAQKMRPWRCHCYPELYVLPDSEDGKQFLRRGS